MDLSLFNKSVSKLKFRMLAVRHLLESILPGDSCASIDLKDDYFHVPIVPRHSRFLRFFFQGMAYVYTRLPFGYTLAPRTFTKCMNAALQPLREQGVRVLAYLDDLLVLAPSSRLAMEHTTSLVSHLNRLGFAIDWEKSSLVPSCQVTYLGLNLNTETMRASLSDPRRRNLELALQGARSSGPPLCVLSGSCQRRTR